MNLGTLDKMLKDAKNGVCDFTVNGECSNCGQCCTDFLPMSAQEVARIHTYVKKNGIKIHEHIPPTNQPVQDFTCPFRNDVEHKCDIYPVRPAVCREFLCNKSKEAIEADKRMRTKKSHVVRMRSEFKR